jgi:hypothetical protein
MRLLPMGSLVLTVVASAARAHAEGPVIDHKPVACAVADRYPRFEAKFAPAEGVAKARVVFQSDASDQWWSVAMKADKGGYVAALPQPKKSLKRFRYYIEATDKALGTARTQDYTTNVIASAGECKGVLAAALSSASVILQGPAGVVTLPAGFATTGVVAGAATGTAAGAGAAGGGGGGAAGGAGAAAGGGGIGTGVIVAGAAVAAAGAAVAVSASKGEDDSGGGGTKYTGPINGNGSIVQTFSNSPGVCTYNFSASGSAEVFLNPKTGGLGQFSYNYSDTVTSISGGPTCTGLAVGTVSGGDGGACDLTGSQTSFSCTRQTSSNPNSFSQSTATHAFSGTLSGGVVTGTLSVNVDTTINPPGSGTTVNRISFTILLILR